MHFFKRQIILLNLRSTSSVLTPYSKRFLTLHCIHIFSGIAQVDTLIDEFPAGEAQLTELRNALVEADGFVSDFQDEGAHYYRY